MKKELFETIFSIVKSIKLDKWYNQTSSGYTDKFDYIRCGLIKITQHGLLRVDDINQRLSWRQKRTLKKFYFEIEEEVATRAVQRFCDKAQL